MFVFEINQRFQINPMVTADWDDESHPSVMSKIVANQKQNY